MKKLIPLITLSCFAVASASAVELYDTQFTSADGFTEGADINGVDGWTAQTQLDSTDVAGDGELTWSANFTRGFNAGTAFAVGDIITITTSIKSVNANTPGFTANLFNIGLTDDTNLGTSDVDAGVRLTAGGTGSNFGLQALAGGTNTDTGIAINNSYQTLTTTITKSATLNEFTVSASLDGFNLGNTTITDAALYGAATVYTLVFHQGSGTGGVSLDSLNVSIVPEPSTYAMLAGLSALAFVMVRRRK